MTIKVQLRPRRDKRVAAGHPWVFANEIDGDVKNLPLGGTVDVHDAKGKFLGRGYANPRSLIAIRICTRRRKEDIDRPEFFMARFMEAQNYRRTIFPDRKSMREIYAEGDGVPGLIIDRYDDILAVQIGTLGIEERKDALREAIERVYKPAGVVLRNDSPMRSLEGLSRSSEKWFGEVPDLVEFDEMGIRFAMPTLGGQKTGHFFDQAENRAFAGPLCAGKTVLDVYSNTGGWALSALRNGAISAVMVDKDPNNVELGLNNAELNGFEGKLEGIADEGKKTLEILVSQGRQFGAVVLDPPAFAKTKKAVGAALKGYREINTLGLLLTQPGGVFFTSSCSHHIYEDRFLELVNEAARMAGRRLRLIRRGEQSSDHPVLPGVPETRYLKSYAFFVEMGV